MSLNKYILIEERESGFEVLGSYANLSEAVQNYEFNTGRYDSDRKIYITKTIAYKVTYEEVLEPEGQ